jgi:hypothetical protein
MTEIALTFFIGFIVGLVMRPKDKNLQEQKDIYEARYKEYEDKIKYYKDLCKWHVEQRKSND